MVVKMNDIQIIMDSSQIASLKQASKQLTASSNNITTTTTTGVVEKPKAFQLIGALSRAYDEFEKTAKEVKRLKADEKYILYKLDKVNKSLATHVKPIEQPLPLTKAAIEASQIFLTTTMLFPLLEATKKHERYQDSYVRKMERASCVYYTDILAQNPPHLSAKYDILAIDCEMVKTYENDMDLARLSVVDAASHQVVLDEYVYPSSYILDSRESITGINESMLKEKGISFKECQIKFASLLHANTVIIGHSLDHDLAAIKVRHPHVLDTGFLFRVGESPEKEMKTIDGLPYTHSLAYLAEVVLSKKTDRESRGGIHDSCEDALLTIQLVKELLNRETSLPYARYQGTTMYIPRKPYTDPPKRKSTYAIVQE